MRTLDGFPAWVAALDGAEGGAAAAPAGAAAGSAQSAFQLMPMGAPGFLEYTVEIDGQTLRYRNGTAQWASFVWPNPGGTPGVRISGITLDNRTVEVFSAPGAYGFERLIAAAQVNKLPDGVRELRWGEGRNAITLHYRAITMPGASQAAGGSGAPRGKGLRGLSLPALVAGTALAEASVAAAGVAP
jgi:type VI secretion system protein ImpL